jgi:uncharacterized protein with HEPN domain
MASFNTCFRNDSGKALGVTTSTYWKRLNLEIIGETSYNINKHYPDYAEQHASVPFAVAYEMRNALTHGYFKVDLEILWKTIELDLPDLKVMIESLLQKFD